MSMNPTMNLDKINFSLLSSTDDLNSTVWVNKFEVEDSDDGDADDRMQPDWVSFPLRGPLQDACVAVTKLSLLTLLLLVLL